MNNMDTVVITASEFKNSGGWVLDTQFFTTMGMPYLWRTGSALPLKMP